MHRPDLGALARAFRRPVADPTRAALDEAWRRLPADLRTGNQFLGRHYAGCGATIGVQPRCDFACHGCYLGDDANVTPGLPLTQVRRQLDRIRAWLGEGGNVQLTDGEVTLRPEDELVAIARHARAIGLVPMLMTHGDSFRRRPALLPRLMTDGGLTEVSIHIDTTQRGRLGQAYRHAHDETQLDPLRDEIAMLLRHARRATGRRLEAAMTVTVTDDNLAGVPAIIRWLLANADAFKMVSFQPVADVGRTRGGLGRRTSAETVWHEIAAGLGQDESTLAGSEGWLGHPDCSRFVQGLVVDRGGGDRAFHPLLGDPHDRAFVGRHLDRLGGLTFRLDTKAEAWARLAGLVCQHPRHLVRDVAPLTWRWLRRLSRGRPLQFLREWRRGDTHVHYLNIVSHHFMSGAELATSVGRERVASCAFRVPLGDEMVSMCEANAHGRRAQLYASMRPPTGVSYR